MRTSEQTWPTPSKPAGKTLGAFFASLAASALALSGCATSGGPEVAGRTRSTVLGPVYERTVSASGDSLLALRPLFARKKLAGDRQVKTEVLWPLFSSRRQSNQFNWRAGVWFGSDYDVENPDSISRFWLLPFWFHGTNREGKPYRALFPLGGRIDGIIGLDRFSFVLFPLYEKHERNGIVTQSYLWPLISFSRSESKDIRRAGFFPLYGVSRRGGEWTSRYALWPIGSHRTFSGDEQGQGWMLFPLFGRVKTNRQQGWTFLPPFFSVHERGQESRRNLPWPFVQLQDGRVRKRYIWPLYGTRRAPGVEASFVLWPLWRTRKIDGGDSRIRNRRLIPFWDQSRVFKKATGEVTYAYDQLWPLWSRERQGRKRMTRVLDLWPGRNREAVDRNWSPWWTLYQRVSSPSNSSWQALFGLLGHSEQRERGRASGRLWPLFSWHRQESPGGELPARTWNLLGGLVGYRRDSEGERRLRVGYGFNFSLGSALPAPSRDGPVSGDDVEGIAE